MRSAVLRRTFIDFMVKHGHFEVPAVPVIPTGQVPAGTYFVNSGIFQFRDQLLQDSPIRLAHKRLTNCQGCIRVGGKDSDLATVGRDNIHHSFFEMLGSWSFGDYPLETAAELALQFLVNEIGLTKEDIRVTYYEDGSCDLNSRARELWKRLGINKVEGRSDNYWKLGELGPCGWCTELHYPLMTGEMTELWNIVNIESVCVENGRLIPLKEKGCVPFVIDTGMGLERLCAVVQGASSTFGTDLFRGLIERIEAISSNEESPYTRIVADHARTVTVAISNGLQPGKNDMGGVVRRMVERCLDIASTQWDMKGPFLHRLVDAVGESGLPLDEKKLPDVRRVIRSAEDRYLQKKRRTRNVVTNYIQKHSKATITDEDMRSLNSRHGEGQLPLPAVEETCRNLGVKFDISAKGRSCDQVAAPIQKGDDSAEVADDVLNLIKDGLQSLDGLLVRVKQTGDYVVAKLARLNPLSDGELEEIDRRVKPDGILLDYESSSDGLFSLKFVFGTARNKARQKGAELRQLWKRPKADAWEKLKDWKLVADELDNRVADWSPSERRAFKKQKPSDHSAKKAISKRLQSGQTLEEEIPQEILIGALHMLSYDEPKEIVVTGQRILLYPDKVSSKEGDGNSSQWLSDRILLLKNARHCVSETAASNASGPSLANPLGG